MRENRKILFYEVGAMINAGWVFRRWQHLAQMRVAVIGWGGLVVHPGGLS